MYELPLEQAGALTSTRLHDVTRIVVERDVLLGNRYTDEEWADPATQMALQDNMRNHPCFKLDRSVSSALHEGRRTVIFEDDSVVREAMKFYAMPLKEDAWRMHYQISSDSSNITLDEYRGKPDAWSHHVIRDNLKPYVRLYLLDRGADPDDALVEDYMRIVVEHIAEASRICGTPPYLCYAFDHDNPPIGWSSSWHYHPSDRACLDYRYSASKFGRFHEPPIRGN